MVTDEIENEKSNGEFFAQLFYKYYMQVYPAKLVFVSFLEDPNVKGRMVQSLESLGIVPLQFRLDSIRPDLTKVDSLLGSLSSECDYFNVQVEMLSKLWESTHDLDKVLIQLENIPMPEDLTHMKKNKGEEEEEEEGDGAEQNLASGRNKGKQKVNENPPPDFLCPITNEVMKDPVVASDGHTYEKTAIEEWFRKSNTSPMTGVALEMKTVFPNFNLRSRIKDWVGSEQKNSAT